MDRKETFCIKESCTAEGPPMVPVLKIQDPHPCSFMVTHKKGGGGVRWPGLHYQILRMHLAKRPYHKPNYRPAQRYIEINQDPLLFCVAHGIHILIVLRETLTQYITFHGGGRGESVLLYSVVLQRCCPESTRYSVRIVTKSPKVKPLLIVFISLSLHKARYELFQPEIRMELWIIPSLGLKTQLKTELLQALAKNFVRTPTHRQGFKEVKRFFDSIKLNS